MGDEFLRLQPNQMLLLKTLIATGSATSYALYQRMKEDSLLVKIASITMVYPIIDSLVKKDLVEISEQKMFGKQERKKYRVTGLGDRVFSENQRAYRQLVKLIPQQQV